MPESALTAPKEKKLTGRQWFESGKAVYFSESTFSNQIPVVVNYLSCAIFQRGTVVAADQESEEEDDEDIDFQDDDFEGKMVFFCLVSTLKQCFLKDFFF